MATQKVDIEGTNITASQMSEFFRLASSFGGHVNRRSFQAYIEERLTFTALPAEDLQELILRLGGENSVKKILSGEINLSVQLGRMDLNFSLANCPLIPSFMMGSGRPDDRRIVEMDPQAELLSAINFSQIRFVDMLRPGEMKIYGDERRRRIKASKMIPLSSRVAMLFCAHSEKVPTEFRYNDDGSSREKCFDGTVFDSVTGFHERARQILCVYWNGSRWDHRLRWAYHNVTANEPSAVLEVVVE